MLRYLFDTDHLTLFQLGNVAVSRRLAMQPAGAVAISIVTAQESLRGRVAFKRFTHELLTLLQQRRSY